jgi:hypothetical protein
LRAIVCVPILLRNEISGEMETSGVIYADNFLPTQDLPQDCATTLRILSQIGSDRMQQWWRLEAKQLQLDRQREVLAHVTEELAGMARDFEAWQSPDAQKEPRESLEEIQHRVLSIQEELGALTKAEAAAQ